MKVTSILEAKDFTMLKLKQLIRSLSRQEMINFNNEKKKKNDIN